MTLNQAAIEIRSLDVDSRSFDVVASSETVDSHGSIVKQDWKLDRYKRNPVVFFGHQSRDLPIGKASNVRIEDGELRAKITLVSKDANPLAEQVIQLMREGALRGISAGFRSGKRSFTELEGRSVLVLSSNELFELSVVGIGSNPDTEVKHDDRQGAEQENRSMRNIAKALGINEDASVEDIERAFSAHQTTMTGALEAAREALEAHKEKSAKYDQLIATQAAEEAAREAEELRVTLDGAVESGRITPAKRAHYEAQVARFGPEWLRALLPELPIIGGNEDDARALKGPDTSSTAISAETRRMLEKLGLTEEDHKAAMADEAKEKRS